MILTEGFLEEMPGNFKNYVYPKVSLDQQEKSMMKSEGANSSVKDKVQQLKMLKGKHGEDHCAAWDGS